MVWVLGLVYHGLPGGVGEEGASGAETADAAADASSAKERGVMRACDNKDHIR